MTSQTKHFVELSDIIAIRCECQNCQATMTIPLSAHMKVAATRICPNCLAPWSQMGESTIELIIEKFADSFDALSRAMRTRKEMGRGNFTLLLELRAEAVPSGRASRAKED